MIHHAVLMATVVNRMKLNATLKFPITALEVCGSVYNYDRLRDWAKEHFGISAKRMAKLLIAGTVPQCKNTTVLVNFVEIGAVLRGLVIATIADCYNINKASIELSKVAMLCSDGNVYLQATSTNNGVTGAVNYMFALDDHKVTVLPHNTQAYDCSDLARRDAMMQILKDVKK